MPPASPTFFPGKHKILSPISPYTVRSMLPSRGTGEQSTRMSTPGRSHMRPFPFVVAVVESSNFYLSKRTRNLVSRQSVVYQRARHLKTGRAFGSFLLAVQVLAFRTFPLADARVTSQRASTDKINLDAIAVQMGGVFSGVESAAHFTGSCSTVFLLGRTRCLASCRRSDVICRPTGGSCIVTFS